MVARVFALIIGIDNYKSGSIWNLQSCGDDAKRIKRWLTHDLSVPKDQICSLLNSKATKQAIEDSFISHLVNNPAIERGDAILIYFAGHGSTLPPPKDWFEGSTGSENVEILCPYDHDTKRPEGRVAGISDRSMQALVGELCRIKGDNITLMIDCCFSPLQSRSNTRDRRYTRWTPTIKAGPHDLYSGLWPGARGQKYTNGLGFYQSHVVTHTLLAACRPGEKAMEGKDGGKFTDALLAAKQVVSLHRTSYAHLIDSLLPNMADGQHPLCVGGNKSRILFDGLPFVADPRFVAVGLHHDKRLRIEMGAIHGIVEGSELSVHIHNRRCSLNPPVANVKVLEVHPTWSLGLSQSQDESTPIGSWAQVIRWNNRPPFRVHLKTNLLSVFRGWKLRQQIPCKLGGIPSKGGLNILRVKHSAQADISLRLGGREVVVERHDEIIAANCHRIIRLQKRKGELNVVDDAARFHLHLHRRNPENPLRNLVTMELFRLDPVSWTKLEPNLLENGKANIVYERGAIFTVVIRNQSNMDLWPSLAYMDPNCYAITMLYHPEPSASAPPLQKHGYLEIGSGYPGSEALSFTLADHDFYDSGFLKLFLSSTYAPMGVVEQGPSLDLPSPSSIRDAAPPLAIELHRLWDTVFACVSFIRHSDVTSQV